MKTYIIINLFESKPEAPIFWRPDDAGYTFSPFAAGHYTEEQVMANPDHYNNGKDTIAVPLTDEAMDQLGFQCSISPEGYKTFCKQ